jgi:hypothetical protein
VPRQIRCSLTRGFPQLWITCGELPVVKWVTCGGRSRIVDVGQKKIAPLHNELPEKSSQISTVLFTLGITDNPVVPEPVPRQWRLNGACIREVPRLSPQLWIKLRTSVESAVPLS